MKQLLNRMFYAGLCMAAIGISSFTPSIQATGDQEETQPVISSYFGRSTATGGKIAKPVFDSLLRQGISARDSSGYEYTILGFYFGYGERKLYEDAVGNLVVLTDYLSEYCPGDTLTPAVMLNIFHKTKPGDTAYFDNIKVASRDGRRQFVAKSMMFILTK